MEALKKGEKVGCAIIEIPCFRKNNNSEEYEKIKKTFSEIYKILKENRYMCITSYIYYDEGKEFDFTSDLENLANEIGFSYIDKIIVNDMRELNIEVDKDEINSTRYILVFAKGKSFSVNTEDGISNKNYLDLYSSREKLGIVSTKEEANIAMIEYCIKIFVKEKEIVINSFGKEVMEIVGSNHNIEIKEWQNVTKFSI